MKTSPKTTVEYDSQDYCNRDPLPGRVRGAYHRATARGSLALNHLLDKIVITGQQFADNRETRRLYQDVMRVVENNGHVTLPVSSEPFLAKRPVKVALVCLSAAALVALAIVAKMMA